MTIHNIILPANYEAKCKKDEAEQKYCFLSLLIWVFVICCFIGFVVETVYCFIKNDRLVNKQGLLYGPFKPIYGFGGVLFTLVFYKVRHIRTYLLFILGTVIGASYEYGCSYFQEFFLKSRSWNYSKFKYNIDGRISVVHAFFWGILTILFIKLALPGIIYIIKKIPVKIQNFIAAGLAAFMIFNIFMSLCTVQRQVERMQDIPAGNHFEYFLDKHYNDKKMKETFTHMKFVYVDTDNK